MARIVLEHLDPGSDLKKVLDWLEGEGVSPGGPSECVPPVDILETASTMEIVVDLPGVTADAIQVVFAGGLVVVAGDKRPGGCDHARATFHLAERGFGRFARAFRVLGACDAGRATATLRAGELRLVIPRIEERRGGEIRIPVTAD